MVWCAFPLALRMWRTFWPIWIRRWRQSREDQGVLPQRAQRNTEKNKELSGRNSRGFYEEPTRLGVSLCASVYSVVKLYFQRSSPDTPGYRQSLPASRTPEDRRNVALSPHRKRGQKVRPGF